MSLRGRKPSSEQWGSGNQTGKYSVKLYTIDGVLIYQEDRGGDNTNQIPKGGVVVQWSVASSMATTIANPITYYGSNTVINQSGHSGDLYNYYWTSYSRGADGVNGNTKWHNVYLDGYIPLRVKSIYDPCPYLYRIPSNGTYNQFISNPGWIQYSYLGGGSWNTNIELSWFPSSGRRDGGSSVLEFIGSRLVYQTSTAVSYINGYGFAWYASGELRINRDDHARSYGFSVRCIDFAMLVQFLLTRHSSYKHGSALVSGVI